MYKQKAGMMMIDYYDNLEFIINEEKTLTGDQISKDIVKRNLIDKATREDCQLLSFEEVQYLSTWLMIKWGLNHQWNSKEKDVAMVLDDWITEHMGWEVYDLLSLKHSAKIRKIVEVLAFDAVGDKMYNKSVDDLRWAIMQRWADIVALFREAGISESAIIDIFEYKKRIAKTGNIKELMDLSKRISTNSHVKYPEHSREC